MTKVFNLLFSIFYLHFPLSIFIFHFGLVAPKTPAFLSLVFSFLC